MEITLILKIFLFNSNRNINISDILDKFSKEDKSANCLEISANLSDER
jgi:hypothetical protein